MYRFFLLGVFFWFFFGGFFAQPPRSFNESFDAEGVLNASEVAFCLSERGASLFGADWDPHTMEQKGFFGDSFVLVNYTDCGSLRGVCRERGVEFYPSWFLNSSLHVGVFSLKELWVLAGC